MTSPPHPSALDELFDVIEQAGATVMLDGKPTTREDVKRAALARALVRLPCTGLAATWCPVHGDCRCEVQENGERTLGDDNCPLHSRESTHSENAEDRWP